MSNISFKDHLLLTNVTSVLSDDLSYMFKVSDYALRNNGIKIKAKINKKQDGFNIVSNAGTTVVQSIQDILSYILVNFKPTQIEPSKSPLSLISKNIAPPIFTDEELTVSFVYGNKQIYSIPISFMVKKQNQDLPFFIRKKTIVDVLMAREKSLLIDEKFEIEINIKLSKISELRDILRPIFENIGVRIIQDKYPLIKFRSNFIKVKSYAALIHFLIKEDVAISDLQNPHKSKELNNSIDKMNKYICEVQKVIINIEENKAINES